MKLLQEGKRVAASTKGSSPNTIAIEGPSGVCEGLAASLGSDVVKGLRADAAGEVGVQLVLSRHLTKVLTGQRIAIHDEYSIAATILS